MVVWKDVYQILSLSEIVGVCFGILERFEGSFELDYFVHVLVFSLQFAEYVQCTII